MPNPYKIFTDLTQYTKERRPYLADLLRPLINDRTLAQNRTIYGAVVDQYTLVTDPGRADWAVLPLAWNYYHKTGQLGQALAFVEQAKQAGKPVLTWVSGDFGARVPVRDVWVIGAAGYRSRAGPRRLGMPVIIRDPLAALGMKEIRVRKRGARPKVGFCGYAYTSRMKSAGFVLRTLFRNAAAALHWSGEEPQDPVSPVRLRQQILGLLARHPGIETDFIPRSRYKAGVVTKEAEQTAHREFFENIRDTDYTVCVRGGGNFSVRLYETLAMGRIPVLVDTDCLLPFAQDPRWRECCVYVERHEIPRIAEKVLAFHEGLSEDEFRETQCRARRFWEERLSFAGYFQCLPGLIAG